MTDTTPPPDAEHQAAPSGDPAPGGVPGSRDRLADLRQLEGLRRSVTDRKLAGVAGGLGRHLDVDPTILRVAFVVLAFFGGAGLVLYAALWLLVPEDGKEQADIPTDAGTRNTILIVVGVAAAVLVVGDAWGGWWFPFPLVILGVIAFLLYQNKPWQRSESAPPGTPPATTATTPSHAPAATATRAYVPPLPATGAYVPPPPVDPAPPAWTPSATPPPEPWRSPRRARGPLLLWPTLAAIALACGLLGLLEVGGLSVPEAAYPALALAVTGAALVLGAWYGRAGGLVLVGVLLSIALAVTSMVGTFGGPYNVDEIPATASELSDSYTVGAGSIRLDLTEIDDLENLDGRTVELSANLGEIIVLVPDGLDVDVDAEVGVVGDIQIGDQTRSGGDAQLSRSLDGGEDVPTLQLDLSMLTGALRVSQQP